MVAIGTLLLPAVLALDSCGLPGPIPSLVAPVVPANYFPDQSNNTFEFQNQPQINPGDFYGFEIYYKFYDNTNTNAGTAYYADNTQLNSTTTGPSQLISLGFRRAYLAPPGYVQGSSITLPATPLIPVTDSSLKSTSFAVTISFNGAMSQSSALTTFFPEVQINGQALTVQSSGQTGPLAMGRYLGVPSGNNNFPQGTDMLEGFGSYDFSSDQGTNNQASPPGDIPTSLTDQSGSSSTLPSGIVIGLYAIAYGLVNLTTPIYSTPTALGYVTYTNPTVSNLPSNPSNPP